MKIRLVATLVVLVMLFFLKVVSAAEEVFVMVPKGVHPYYEPCYAGFEAAGKKFGVKTEYAAPQDFQLPLQIQIIEELIARKVTGIAISAVSNEGLVDVIKQATDAGIKVICYDADAPASERLCYIGTDNKNAGAVGAQHMAKYMGDKGEIAILQSGEGASNINLRYAGFVSKMSNIAPEVKIVTRQNTEGKFKIANSKAEVLLRAYPNLKGIFGLSAECAPGAAIAIADAGKEGAIICGGFDDLPDTIEAIKAGTVQFCLAQMTYKMGWLSLTGLLQACAGEQLPAEIDTGILVITKENADSYLQQMQEETQNLQ